MKVFKRIYVSGSRSEDPRPSSSGPTTLIISNKEMEHMKKAKSLYNNWK